MKEISPKEGRLKYVHENQSISNTKAIKAWLSSQTSFLCILWPDQLDHVLSFHEVWERLKMDLNYNSVMNASDSNGLLWDDVVQCFDTVLNLFVETAVNNIPFDLIKFLNN